MKSSAQHFLVAFASLDTPPSPARAMRLAGWEGSSGMSPARGYSNWRLYIWSEVGAQIHLEGRGGAVATEYLAVNFPGDLAAQEGGDISLRLSGNSLVCARALPGIIPLAWRRIGDVWWLSSDLEVLRLLSPTLTRPNLARVRAYLHGYSWAPDTGDFISGIERVPAGWKVEVDALSGVTSSSRVRDDTWPSRHDRSLDEARVWDELQRAFSRADARGWEVGGYASTLSGGLDSGVWCGWASRHARSPLRTASILFDDSPRSDERGAIWRVVEVLQPRQHVDFHMDDVRPLNDLAFYKQFLGFGPRHHPGEVYETDFLRRVALEYGVSTIATGIGADELFRGFATPSLRASMARGDLRAIAFWGRTLGKSALWTQAGLSLAQRVLPPKLLRALAVAREQRRVAPEPEWLAPLGEADAGDEQWTQQALALLLESDGLVTFCSRWFESWEWELAVRVLWRNMRGAGVAELLPYLDRELWRVLIALPPELRWGEGDGRLLDKLALRRVAQRQQLLPDGLAWRPKLVFFDQHINKGWAVHEAERTKSLLNEMRCVEYGVVDGESFTRYLRQSMSAFQMQKGGVQLNPHSIWRTLAVELWLRYLSA